MKSSVESVKTIAWNIYLFERACRLHLSEQYFTSSQQRSHFFRQSKGVDNRHIFSGVDAVFHDLKAHQVDE